MFGCVYDNGCKCCIVLLEIVSIGIVTLIWRIQNIGEVLGLQEAVQSRDAFERSPMKL